MDVREAKVVKSLGRRGLSNNRAGRHKAVGFLLLLFICGCSLTYEEALEQYECTWHEEGHGWCCKHQLPDPCYLQRLRDGKECSD